MSDTHVDLKIFDLIIYTHRQYLTLFGHKDHCKKYFSNALAYFWRPKQKQQVPLLLCTLLKSFYGVRFTCLQISPRRFSNERKEVELTSEEAK